MQEVMGDLMGTLWGHLKPQNNPFGPRVLNLLGKMGGRNRRFLRSPAELEYKENPEHGLRLILTFQPSTSFLVPLDRSIALCRAAVNGTSAGGLSCLIQLVTTFPALLNLLCCGGTSPVSMLVVVRYQSSWRCTEACRLLLINYPSS